MKIDLKACPTCGHRDSLLDFTDKDPKFYPETYLGYNLRWSGYLPEQHSTEIRGLWSAWLPGPENAEKQRIYSTHDGHVGFYRAGETLQHGYQFHLHIEEDREDFVVRARTLKEVAFRRLLHKIDEVSRS